MHYLSGFFGPIERALRDSGANISFAPADFRRFEPLLEAAGAARDGDRRRPARRRRLVQPLAARRRHLKELLRAGADPDRLLVVETSPAFPRTCGIAAGASATRSTSTRSTS